MLGTCLLSNEFPKCSVQDHIFLNSYKNMLQNPVLGSVGLEKSPPVCRNYRACPVLTWWIKKYYLVKRRAPLSLSLFCIYSVEDRSPMWNQESLIFAAANPIIKKIMSLSKQSNEIKLNILGCIEELHELLLAVW